MAERERVLLSALAGAAIGAAAGFLMLTSRGKIVREQFEPRLDEFLRNMQRLQASVHKARSVAEESWRSIQEILEEATPTAGPSVHPDGLTEEPRSAERASDGPFDKRWEAGTRPH
jgi:gas vesicle protein